MAEKDPVLKFNTAVVPFVLASLDRAVKWDEPTQKYLPHKYGDYNVKARVQPSDLPAGILDQLTVMRDAKAAQVRESLIAKGNGADAKKLKVADVLTEETHKQTGEPTGAFIINAKKRGGGISKKTNEEWFAKPDLFDAFNNPYVGRVYGGSEGILSIEATPYYVGGTKTVGISFRLQAAQITKLVNGSGPRPAASYGFAPQAAAPQVEREPGSDDNQGDDDIAF